MSHGLPGTPPTGHPADQPAEGEGPAPGGEPRQRLHPLSPALHGAKSLAVVVAGLSWSTLSRVGFGWFAAMVAVLAPCASTVAGIRLRTRTRHARRPDRARTTGLSLCDAQRSQ